MNLLLGGNFIVSHLKIILYVDALFDKLLILAGVFKVDAFESHKIIDVANLGFY